MVLAVIVGIMIGTVTGLTPGVHINLVATILVSSSTVLLLYASPLSVAFFIISMSVTHTFLDTLPSIFLGIPDESMVLGILPAQKMVLEGQGVKAVFLTVLGCLLSLYLIVPLIFFSIPFLPRTYQWIEPWIVWILLTVVIFMILRDDKKCLATALLLLSGAFGIIVFSLPLSQPMLPMLSGLFGVSGVVLSLFTAQSFPHQAKMDDVSLDRKEVGKAMVGSILAGGFTGVFPGLGAAHAAILASQLVRKISHHGFLIMMGGIGTVNFVFSLAALFALEKARNGSVIAIMSFLPKITFFQLSLFSLVAIVSGSVAAILTILIAKQCSTLLPKVPYAYLSIGIISLIVILVLLVNGWLGLAVLFVATCLGLLPQLLGTNRSHMMGCLLLPVIFFFLL